MARKEKEGQKINWAIFASVSVILAFLVWLWEDIKKIIEKGYQGITSGNTVEPIGGNGKEILSNLSERDTKLISESLFKAMDKIGTDFKIVVEEIGNLSPADYEKVFISFGKKPYSWTLGRKPILNLWYHKYNLTEWLKFEFDKMPKVIEVWERQLEGSSFN